MATPREGAGQWLMCHTGRVGRIYNFRSKTPKIVEVFYDRAPGARRASDYLFDNAEINQYGTILA
jgi:hypothetical protein